MSRIEGAGDICLRPRATQGCRVDDNDNDELSEADSIYDRSLQLKG